MKTQKTTNYDLFRFIKSNRPVYDSHVLNIAKAIERRDLTEANPILVNEKMEVIDGQHRLAACKLLSIPVFYHTIELNGSSDKTIIDLNCLQHVWRINEFVHHFTMKGKEDYIKLSECEAKYHFGISASAVIVSNGKRNAKDLRAGKFVAGKIHYDTIASIVLDFKTIVPTFWNNLRFITSLTQMIVNRKYNHKEHFHKFIKNQHGLFPCATEDQYKTMIQKIIDKGRRKHNQIK